MPNIRPGQFLHLAIDDYQPSDHWPTSRVFSIARINREESKIVISYSVKGTYTTRMAKEIEVDDHVWIKLPYGDFLIDGSRDVVLIAGGTGITAYTSFLESLDDSYGNQIQLFYGARTLDLLIYKELIAEVNKSSSNLDVSFFLEDLHHKIIWEEIPISPGRLSIMNIWDTLEKPINFVYYLSGPPEMLKQFSSDLLALGLRESNIRIDAWE